MIKIMSIVAIVISTTFISKGEEMRQSGDNEIKTFIMGQKADAEYERSEFNYGSAEKIVAQAIMMFDSQPESFQTENESLKAELYYDLARYRSMQGNKEEAVEALKLAVDYGWNDYDKTKSEADFKSIRWQKGYREVIKALKPKK